MSRRHRIDQCHPEWVERDGVRRAITFDCPESAGGCDGRHRIPINGFAPCSWSATGELAEVTLKPSIACRGACQMHITITNGAIDFSPDSKSGPDWNSKQ